MSHRHLAQILSEISYIIYFCQDLRNLPASHRSSVLAQVISWCYHHQGWVLSWWPAPSPAPAWQQTVTKMIGHVAFPLPPSYFMFYDMDKYKTPSNVFEEHRKLSSERYQEHSLVQTIQWDMSFVFFNCDSIPVRLLIQNQFHTILYCFSNVQN